MADESDNQGLWLIVGGVGLVLGVAYVFGKSKAEASPAPSSPAAPSRKRGFLGNRFAILASSGTTYNVYFEIVNSKGVRQNQVLGGSVNLPTTNARVVYIAPSPPIPSGFVPVAEQVPADPSQAAAINAVVASYVQKYPNDELLFVDE